MNYIDILSVLLLSLLINTCHSMMDSDLIQTNYNKDNLDSSKTSEVYNLLELRKKAFQASSGQYVAINNKDKELFNMIKNQIVSRQISLCNAVKQINSVTVGEQTNSGTIGAQTNSCNVVKQTNSCTASALIKPCMAKYILNNKKNITVPMSNIHSIRTSSNNNNTKDRNVKNINKTYIYV